MHFFIVLRLYVIEIIQLKQKFASISCTRQCSNRLAVTTIGGRIVRNERVEFKHQIDEFLDWQ